MKKLVGLLAITTALSAQGFEPASDIAPPFSTIICEGLNTIIQVELNHYRQTNGKGPASIFGDDLIWLGSWTWSPAPQDTRLTGYYYLGIMGQNPYGGESKISLRTNFSPFGRLSGGWMQNDGESGSVECEILQ